MSIANSLFRFQGYPNTGINQVIAESECAKASFYQYFPSKVALGQECLRDYSTGQIAVIGKLLERSPDPRDFIAAWARLLKREARNGLMFGCPIANFKAQVGPADHSFDDVIYDITSQTLALLASYLRRARETGYLAYKEADEVLARRIFSAYHGVLQTWRLTGDLTVFDEMKPLFFAAIGLKT